MPYRLFLVFENEMLGLLKPKHFVAFVTCVFVAWFVASNIVLKKLQHSEKQGILNMPLTYTSKATTLRGKRFQIDGMVPCHSPSHFINLTNYDVWNFTFVTAADRKHFNESKDAIAGFQKVFPGYRFVYYDLGLDPEDAEKVKQWCNVELRTIDYDKYPPNIRDHPTYGFKSVIIYIMIHEVEAIFWIDASIRPLVTNKTKWSEVFDVVKESGVLLFDRTGHFMYTHIHPEMYNYLPVDMDRFKKLEMLGSCAVLLYRTERIFWEIIHWHYLCGLTTDCITPPGHTLDCPNVTSNVTFCHRYDQSSLNILVANFAIYDDLVYTSPPDFIVVDRYPTQMFQLDMCKWNSTELFV